MDEKFVERFGVGGLGEEEMSAEGTEPQKVSRNLHAFIFIRMQALHRAHGGPRLCEYSRNFTLLYDNIGNSISLLMGKIIGPPPPTPTFLISLVDQRHGEFPFARRK
ncbi:unnamed protein product [Parascedosporium putredinis]|uniref:Uncharacterized protein n=1 Tax=Parascedosporium putredinis TaxID=1442378 RepID=A0A9P1H5A8_9PEZI|nr:unnamed protein product [Parascedosporium putredinis]CAI7999077.1 unnamed protein product [Parascedosporium putredinis]